MKTKKEIRKIEVKIERAIDRLIDLQDLGFGCQEISMCIDKIRCIEVSQ
jgi:hypothetical protein